MDEYDMLLVESIVVRSTQFAVDSRSRRRTNSDRSDAFSRSTQQKTSHIKVIYERTFQ